MEKDDPTEFRHDFAKVNGIRLHYATAGRGKPMIFVHGFPEFWRAWEDQLREFSRDHQAIAPDMRGYNLSEKPEGVEAYASRELVEDLRQFIRSFSLEPVILVAHDWGGVCAWTFAMRYPDYLERLIIINSPHPGTLARELQSNPAQQEAMRYTQLFRSAKAEQVMSENDYMRLARLFDGWSPAGKQPDPNFIAAYKQAWSQPGALTGGLNYYRATQLHPEAPGEPGVSALKLDHSKFKVHVPTQVIWGEKDPALLPCLLDGLEDYIPDLRIDRIPEGSHWVVHEFPDQVNALIRDFLSEPA